MTHFRPPVPLKSCEAWKGENRLTYNVIRMAGFPPPVVTAAYLKFHFKFLIHFTKLPKAMHIQSIFPGLGYGFCLFPQRYILPIDIVLFNKFPAEDAISLFSLFYYYGNKRLLQNDINRAFALLGLIHSKGIWGRSSRYGMWYLISKLSKSFFTMKAFFFLCTTRGVKQQSKGVLSRKAHVIWLLPRKPLNSNWKRQKILTNRGTM